MRAIDTERSGSFAWLQIFLVILAGLSLAWLVLSVSGILLAAAVLGGMFFIGFLRRPDLGLLAVLLVRASTDATLQFVSGPAGGESGPVGVLLTPNLGLLVVLVIGGGIIVLLRQLPFISLPGGVLFTLLVVMGLIGASRSEDFLLSVDQWTPVAGALIAYALAASLFPSPQQVRRVIDVLAASFIVPAVVGLYQLATGQGAMLADIDFPRVRGTFVHANPFGLYLVLILSVFMNQVLVQQGRRKFMAICIVAVASVLLVASFARFAWVGAAVVLLTLGILRSRALLVLAPLALALAVAFVPAIAERFSDPLGGSFADRVSIWTSILTSWQSLTAQGEGLISVAVNRLSGLGPGSSLMLAFGMRGTHPHNDYVRIFIEYGALGLGLYVVLFAVLIVTAYRAWRGAADPLMSSVVLSFLGLTIAYPVMSITAQIFGLMANQVYFWTLAGLTVSVGRLSSRHVGLPHPISTNQARIEGAKGLQGQWKTSVLP